MSFATMTETEEEDMQIAKDAYAIMRGSKGAALFPHHWDGLPEHYKELLFFTVAHARQFDVD